MALVGVDGSSNAANEIEALPPRILRVSLRSSASGQSSKESHMSIGNLPNAKPSVLQTAANLVLSTDVTVIVLWSVTGMFATALALSTGFIPLLE